MRLIGKKRITGEIKLISGLHIGDSKESADIGGLDSPVVRRKDNNQPYIPGSSLKGKMRCLLEQMEGASDVGKGSEMINRLFGITEIKKNGETTRKPELCRAIFRDCYMTQESIDMLNQSNVDTDMPFTEIKFENTIDRVKGAAKQGGLRNIERVPAGAVFNFELVLNVYDGDNDEYIKLLNRGILLLNADYIGGSGTRGYGNVDIKISPAEDIKI